MGALYCWASPSRSIAGEAVPAFYLGTSYTHTPKRFSDFDGLQRAELSLLAGHLTGGDMLYIHFEPWDWGPPIHVGPQSPTSICNRAP